MLFRLQTALHFLFNTLLFRPLLTHVHSNKFAVLSNLILLAGGSGLLVQTGFVIGKKKWTDGLLFFSVILTHHCSYAVITKNLGWNRLRFMTSLQVFLIQNSILRWFYYYSSKENKKKYAISSRVCFRM